MKTGYENRMTSSSHVREVGPHVHGWKTVGNDGNGDYYQECLECGTRRVQTPARGRMPIRQDWLDGGPWEVALPEEEVEKKGKARRRIEEGSAE